MVDDAYDVAVRLLAMRAHSEGELATKLQRRGFEADAIGEAVARLRAHRYLDDAAYARGLVRLRAGKRSRAAIGAELAAKGIGREIAAEALAELDDEAQLEAAKRLVTGWSSLSAEQVAGRLQRRGFQAAIIHSVLRDSM